MRKPSVLILLLLTFRCLTCTSQECEIEELILLVFEDGFVEVSYLARLMGEEVEAELPLLGEPEEGFIVITDENGILLNYEIKEGKVLVESLGAELINVTYHTLTLTKLESGLWTINVTSPSNRTTIKLPESSIVVGLSDVPSSISTENGRTVLVFDKKGVLWISYVLEFESPLPSSETGIRRSLRIWSVPIAVGLVSAILLFLRRRSKKIALKFEELPYVDRLIIEELRARGGYAFQSELIKALDLPKTTVWRHLKKLEEEGLVEIRKVRGMNRVKLTFK